MLVWNIDAVRKEEEHAQYSSKFVQSVSSNLESQLCNTIIDAQSDEFLQILLILISTFVGQQSKGAHTESIGIGPE